MSEWAKVIQSVIAKKDVQTPEKGYKSVLEISGELGLSRGYTESMLMELVRSGNADRKKFRTPVGLGNFSRRTWHYKLKKT